MADSVFLDASSFTTDLQYDRNFTPVTNGSDWPLPLYSEMAIYFPAGSLAAIFAGWGDLYQVALVPFGGNQVYLHDSVGGGSYDSWIDKATLDAGGSPVLGHIAEDSWHIVRWVQAADGDPTLIEVDGDQQTATTTGEFFPALHYANFGLLNNGPAGSTCYLGGLRIGTTLGGKDILDYCPVRDGDPTSYGFNADGFPVFTTAPTPPPDCSAAPPIPPIPPGSIAYQSPLWRFVVGDLVTFETLSFLDRLASQRTVTITLNQAASSEGVVPSDNPEINLPWPDADSDPFLTEGSRVLWGFRKEGTIDAPPVWQIRFAGIIQQLEDTAQSDNAYSHYTAYDPWQYLLSRPVCNADGSLPGPNGISFASTRINVIAGELLANTIINNGVVGIDAGILYGGSGFYSGTIETLDRIDINFAQGTTVGQAWKQLTDADLCDIVLTPIYDPIERPGYLVEFNIYAQVGSARDDAIFAWDMPSRSLVGIDRTYSGTERSNVVKYFAGQGGSAPGGQTITEKTDAASIAKYGEYWRQQFFPNQTVAAAVEALAEAQLALSKNGRVTVVFSPAPERSPVAFNDYYLGDRVPVYASRRFRAPIPDPNVPTSDQQNYQRIYGIPITIADDATEQVQQMLTAIPSG